MDPKVGVGVFVVDETGRIVVGQRKGSHGGGTWGLPGGHLEFGESFEACAGREVLEETGLAVDDFYFLTATNNIMKREREHYVTVFVGCKVKGERMQPEVIEPEKCERWEWVTWEDIRAWGNTQFAGNPGGRKLFSPLLDLLAQQPTFTPVQKKPLEPCRLLSSS